MVLTGRPWTPPDGVEHALIELSQYDGSHTHHWKRHYDVVISVAPLPLSLRALPFLADTTKTRFVFLSSNNAALLRHNPDYDPIRWAEQDMLAQFPSAVILQPTTISGRKGDAVIGSIIRQALSNKRIFIPGLHTRQHPVDYRDVARAICHAVDHTPRGGLYSLAGPDALTYAEIIRIIETALWKPVRAYNIPAWVARVMGYSRLFPGSAALRRSGFDRDPVHTALPGFIPRYGFLDMVHALTEQGPLPS